MKKYFWILLVFITLICGPVGAEAFGVRPAGLGGAFVAVASDENALFYNPAGLTKKSLTYAWQNLDVGNLKFIQTSANIFILGPLAYASAGWQSSDGSFFNENALGYGQASFQGLDWGVKYKHLEEKSGPSLVQNGWAVDLGLLAHLTPGLNWGFSSDNLLHSQNTFQPSYRTGLAFFPMKDEDLILAVDVNYEKSALDNRTLKFYSGAELNLTEGLRLRGGWNDGAPCFGFGVDLPFFTLDYGVSFLSAGNYQKFGLAWHLFEFPGRRKPTLLFKEKEALVLEIGGPVVGGVSEWSFLGGYKTGADEILAILKRAAEDPYLDAVVLHIYDFSSGFGGEALIEELRGEVKVIKEKGKKVVAYLDGNAGGREYYLASAADQIVTPSLAISGGFGTSLTVTKIYELGKKIGLSWQVLKAGKFKAGLAPYEEKIPDELRLQLLNLLKDIQNNEVSEITQTRNLKREIFLGLGEGQLISAQKAKELGLVDRLGYFNNALELTGELLGIKGSPKVIKPEDLDTEEEHFYLLPFQSKIAVIAVNGEIKSGENYQNWLFGGSYTGSDSVCSQIQKAIDDKSIKAILLRINSPGGSHLASAQIYEALKKARNSGKIVLASLGDLATSGGYYLAAGANKIMAEPSTITGHIGVIGVFPDLEKLYEKIGLGHETIKTGQHLDMLSGIRALTDDEKQMLQNFINDSYEVFLKDVADGRKMAKEKVALLAEGQLYTGRQAQKVGLVDELGNFYDAVKLSQKLAKIDGKPVLVYYSSEYDLFLPFELGQRASSFKFDILKDWGRFLK